MLISWKSYVPTYIRNEFKKKTGIDIDENGDPIVDESDPSNPNSNKGIRGGNNSSVDGSNTNLNSLLYKNGKGATPSGGGAGGNVVIKKEYTPINNYKPTGKMVYNDSLFQHIENKI
jgi:hypothetical protein